MSATRRSKTKPVSRRDSVEVSETRGKLLAVGMDHFLRDGSKALSVRRVAADAGVNLGSFVYHFGTKEAFIRELIVSRYEELLQLFNSGLPKAGPEPAPIVRLRSHLEQMGAVAERHGDLVFRLMTEIVHGEKAIFQILFKSPPLHVPLIRATIEECQKNGNIRNDLSDIQVFMTLVFAIGLPELLLRQAESRLKVAVASKLIRGVLTDRFRSARIDIALKGLAP